MKVEDVNDEIKEESIDIVDKLTEVETTNIEIKSEIPE